MICRFLQYCHKRCCKQRKLWGYWTECYQNCIQCTEIHSTEPFETGIAILQSVLEWQRDKVDWPAENADCFPLIGAIATSL